MTDRGRHWDDAYRTKGSEGVSWYQPEPVVSLELIGLLDVSPTDAVIDVGGGASFLVDRLVESGFSDLSVLDVSEVALQECRRRLKDQPQVTFIQHDVLTWRSSRRFGLWHDRAVFHCLTDEEDRSRYLATMSDSLEPDGSVIVGTFATEGPPRCSGLEVAHYSPAELEELLGHDFSQVATAERSTTPRADRHNRSVGSPPSATGHPSRPRMVARRIARGLSAARKPYPRMRRSCAPEGRRWHSPYRRLDG